MAYRLFVNNTNIPQGYYDRRMKLHRLQPGEEKLLDMADPSIRGGGAEGKKGDKGDKGDKEDVDPQGLQGPEGVVYEDRGDPDIWDFRRSDLIADGEWHELDLSSIVPIAAANQLVHLRTTIEAQIAEKKITFAGLGQVNGLNVVTLLTQVPYVYNIVDAWVKMDENRKVQYKMDSEGIISPHVYARWRLDESSGSIAPDDSGNGRHGTLVNMEDADWVAGKENNCLKFDGTDEGVNCGNIADFERTDSFSLELLFKTGYAGSQDIFNRMMPVQPFTGWIIYMESGGIIQFYLVNTVTGGKYILVTVNGNFADLEWHHILVTYNGSSLASGIHIYIDNVDKLLGVNRNNLIGSIRNTEDCRIGARNRPTYHFNGLIDEVVIYDAELPNINDAWLATNLLVRGWFEQT